MYDETLEDLEKINDFIFYYGVEGLADYDC